VNDVDRKSLGAYYTPEDVARALVRWVVRRPSDQLLDPACGDGRFLTVHRHSTGVERDSAALETARQRAPHACIHQGEFFSWVEKTEARFDCVAGNPPFIRYQLFSGQVRQRALRVCARLGAKFSGLSSSWAPFIVAATHVLKPSGRMAFVVPAEVGHAPYSAPLVSYLAGRFARVQIVAVRQKVFPQLSEDAGFLYAEGWGGRTKHVRLTAREAFQFCDSPPDDGMVLTLTDWQNWGCRLRPFLLPQDTRSLYQDVVQEANTKRLGELARVGIGYVTGANDFFHLRPSLAKFFQIPDSCLYPTVRNARALPHRTVSRQTVEAWLRRDAPVLLLRLSGSQNLPAAVRDYLDTPGGQLARTSYKCRTRSPWYVVPDVRIPDGFLTYMSGEGPALVANAARCACTNSVHGVHMKDGQRFSDLQATWQHPMVRLSCELEGHPLGGGMLKIEPGEAARLAIPQDGLVLSRGDVRCLEDGIVLMRKWRHYE
jgi:adenine-specific DNA-methyltransferase